MRLFNFPLQETQLSTTEDAWKMPSVTSCSWTRRVIRVLPKLILRPDGVPRTVNEVDGEVASCSVATNVQLERTSWLPWSSRSRCFKTFLDGMLLIVLMVKMRLSVLLWRKDGQWSWLSTFLSLDSDVVALWRSRINWSWLKSHLRAYNNFVSWDSFNVFVKLVFLVRILFKDIEKGWPPHIP